MNTWLDRNVYVDNLVDTENSPDCIGFDAVNQSGLKEMNLKAIDILIPALRTTVTRVGS